MNHVRTPLAALAACTIGATALLVPSAAIAAPEPTPTGLVINEIVYDKASGFDTDQVELYNTGNATISLDGWSVADDKKVAEALPAGLSLAPGQHLVLLNGTHFSFGLGKGDAFYLYDQSGAEVDGYAYTNTAPLMTWARCPDGTGPWAPATTVTPGAPNVCAATPGGETGGENGGETGTQKPGSVVLNEIDSQPADWVELFNPGDTPFALEGVELRDNSDDHRWRFTAGVSIAAGGFLVVDENTEGVAYDDKTTGWVAGTFGSAIGIGGADKIRLYSPAGELIDDSGAWTSHAALNGNAAAATLARCVDGEGDFVLAHPTPGEANRCVLPDVAINEIESNGDATDWVEIINNGAAAVDISGWTLLDNDPVGHAADVTPVAAGTMLASGARYVFDQPSHFTFGLGKADTASVRNARGEIVAEHSWLDHAAGVLGRCPDGVGDFRELAASTKGAKNACDGETPGEGEGEGEGETTVAAWPGAAETTVLDPTPTFLSDSSGLDSQATAEGTFLWAVDNGTGRFWKLNVAADGTTSFADGWEQGKRARFQKDAARPNAAGPDSEGITVDGDGWVYLAVERDNSAKGVNYNVVLKLDPNAPGPDVVATQEWDLTALLPQVSANLGMEAVEWVADSDLAGKLWDRNTNAPYDPANYAGHGSGLFFVAVEDQGQVFAVALQADGGARIVSELRPGLGGVMALDYDTVLGVLWAVCDDGCQGTAAQFTLNGTDTPELHHFARPAGLPNLNNEGFATAPAPLVGSSAGVGRALDAGGKRAAWWFADGFESSSLRLGWLDAAGTSGPGGSTGGEGGEGGDTGQGNGASQPVNKPAAQHELAATGAAPIGVLPFAAAALLAAGLAGYALSRVKRGTRGTAERS